MKHKSERYTFAKMQRVRIEPTRFGAKAAQRDHQAKCPPYPLGYTG